VPGERFTITIPVTTTTNLVEASLRVVGLEEAGVTDLEANLVGTNIVITGIAPDLEDEAEELEINYNVSIESGSLGQTLGYEHNEDFTLTVREGDGPVVDDPSNTWTWTGATTIDLADATAFTGTLALAEVHTNPAGTISVAVTEVELALTSGTDAVDAAYKYTYNDNGTVGFTITPAEGTTFPAGTYKIDVVKVTPDYTLPAKVTSRTITVVAPTAPIGKSGGGCDAGFGVFGLLAATGAVALLRKKD
jgi:Synergist-CTERM protein sorting domain-containing protein